MTVQKFVKTSMIGVSAEELFDWHLREGVFERLSPPWDPPENVRVAGSIDSGGTRSFTVRIGPVRKLWIARHTEFLPGRSFVDIQESGPFRYWKHTHRVIPDGTDRCTLQDEIDYELPLGRLGSGLGSNFIRQKLERVFEYRHQVTQQDLQAHHLVMKGRKMRILVSGSGGLVGGGLVPFLKSGGHDVVALRRASPKGDLNGVCWDPARKRCEADKIEGFDAVIHLAGENIAGGRWTAKRKEEIRRSRVEDTRLLAETLGNLKRPPKQLLCASAIGYYGANGDEPLTEESSAGSGFLAEVCRDWEAATAAAQQGGISVSHLRFGIILSPGGGALAKMLLPFKLGAGGILGSGAQYMSWITLDDVVGAIHHVLAHEELSGPINVTAPNPVTNRDFTGSLGKVLRRPTIFPMPSFAARLAFGEMADALLLTGSRVIPEKLMKSGYQFHHPELEAGLRHLLGQ